jgi:hypothetical protein
MRDSAGRVPLTGRGDKSDLAESKDTGGSFEFGEWLGKSGTEPPAYVHEREHEFYYVSEKRD